MATYGIIQRRDIKSALIAGQPSTGSGGDWSGPVVSGEVVFATDTKEYGFLDSAGNLKWVSVDDIGAGVPTGGTTGQTIIKNSDADRDVSWGTLNISQEFIKDGNGYRINGLSSDILGCNAINLSSEGGCCSFGTASGDQSLVIGAITYATGNRSFASGYGTRAEGTNAAAFGSYTVASGYNSLAEGAGTRASGRASHAEGGSNSAVGCYSHAEGFGTCSSGYASHAEGVNNNAADSFSHAEGTKTLSCGFASHTEGCFTQTKGNASHAEGYHTFAFGDNSHAAGQWNVGATIDTIHETGIGTGATDRRNAFEIYRDGRLVAPELSTTLINTNRSLVTKEYVDANSGTDDILVLSTLPAAGLNYFKKLCYAIDAGTINICVANVENPTADTDCFWIQL